MSHYAYARFFEEDNAPEETMPSTSCCMGKDGTKNALQALKEDVPKQHLKKEESKQGDTPSFIK